VKVRLEDWQTNESLILLQGWARSGLTDEQIAGNMGISVRTLYNWKKKSLQILQALKTGAREADFAVENALFKKALSGDVTACIFWLKNRQPDIWREKPEHRMNDGDVPQIVDDIQ